MEAAKKKKKKKEGAEAEMRLLCFERGKFKKWTAAVKSQHKSAERPRKCPRTEPLHPNLKVSSHRHEEEGEEETGVGHRQHPGGL
ncbi:hypothetical protein INR49_007018 [Caranx melampygus]|nr:hypothetical protein INR49_007018 [Caranx melampygus]